MTTSPARKAGLTPRFSSGRGDWSARLVPFRVWDAVSQKIDPRHVGEVTAVHYNTITVRWHNGWTSEHQANELEKVQ